MCLAEPLDSFGADLAARIGARHLEQQGRCLVAAFLRDDEDRVLAQAFAARAPLGEYLSQDRQGRLRVHLHQPLQGGDAHIIIFIRTAAFFAERLRFLGDLLRCVGVAAARLSALDLRAQRLRVLARRGVRVVACLFLDRVDCIAEITLAAELIERVGAVVQGVAGVVRVRKALDELDEKLRGAPVLLVGHRAPGKTVE